MILREAFANFLMHADQFNPLRFCIHVYTNRIEFVNGRKMDIERDFTATTVSFDLKSPLPNQSKSSVKSSVKSKDKIRGLMREEPSISLADMAEAIGISLSGVEKLFAI
ncbi:MAG: hypothetical protein KBS95_00450 [Alistipes sp.]|nr:hypothetical protein [Candidatus Alistipes equi]